MTTTTTGTEGSKGVRVIGLLTIIFGIIFIVAGGVTWGAVSSNLAAEKITVSDDAQAFGGQLVDTPWEAWFQADIINTHALEASGGKTYAELPQDDPTRQTVMTASFLRASLFTSVVAFGVALLVVGIGVVLILLGWAVRHLGKGSVAVVPSAAPVAAAVPVAAAPAPAAHAAPPAAVAGLGAPAAATPDPVVATRPATESAPAHVAPTPPTTPVPPASSVPPQAPPAAPPAPPSAPPTAPPAPPVQ